MKVAINPMPPPLPAELQSTLSDIGFPTIGHFLENGFVEPEIRALVTPAKVVGRAITVRITSPDSVLVHKVTELLEPGDAIVIDTGGNVRHAPVGEMVVFAAKARGAAAIVIDGVCTDIVEIREMGVPVFARGTSVLTTKLHGLGSGAINEQVSCGGVAVNPGDVVLADDNGVLILSPEAAADVLDPARDSDAAEPDMQASILDGGSLAELSGANRILSKTSGYQ